MKNTIILLCLSLAGCASDTRTQPEPDQPTEDILQTLISSSDLVVVASGKKAEFRQVSPGGGLRWHMQHATHVRAHYQFVVRDILFTKSDSAKYGFLEVGAYYELPRQIRRTIPDVNLPDYALRIEESKEYILFLKVVGYRTAELVDPWFGLLPKQEAVLQILRKRLKKTGAISL